MVSCLFLLQVNRNLAIGFFVFLTLSIVVMTAHSLAKTVHAQSDVLGQNGGGISDRINEQLQTSNQDNQIVSGDGSSLSGNNKLCESQNNLLISEQVCNSS